MWYYRSWGCEALRRQVKTWKAATLGGRPGIEAARSIAEATWWKWGPKMDGLKPWRRLGHFWKCHLEAEREKGREILWLLLPSPVFCSLSH
jgi:hypothetical protein